MEQVGSEMTRCCLLDGHRQGRSRQAVCGQRDDAARLYDQGQLRAAGAAYRLPWDIPLRRVSKLSLHDDSAPLVLLGGRRFGGRVQEGIYMRRRWAIIGHGSHAHSVKNCAPIVLKIEELQ